MKRGKFGIFLGTFIVVRPFARATNNIRRPTSTPKLHCEYSVTQITTTREVRLLKKLDRQQATTTTAQRCQSLGLGNGLQTLFHFGFRHWLNGKDLYQWRIENVRWNETLQIIWSVFALVNVAEDEECGCLCMLDVSFHNVALAILLWFEEERNDWTVRYVCHYS